MPDTPINGHPYLEAAPAAPEPHLPIIGLEALLSAPRRQVLVCGPPDAQNALASLLGAHVTVVSWDGPPEEHDWAWLDGQAVVVWPPDPVTGSWLARLILDAGAKVVKIVRPQRQPSGFEDAASLLAYARANSFVASAAALDALDEIAARDSEAEQAGEEVDADDTPDLTDIHASHGPGNRSKSKDGRPASTTHAASAAVLPEQDEDHEPEHEPQRQRHTRGNVVGIKPGISVPPIAPQGEEHWRSRLILSEEGKLKPKLTNNFLWFVRGHPDTRGAFAWNEVAQGVFLQRQPPWQEGSWQGPRALSDDDQVQCVTWLESHGMTPRKNDARDVIRTSAKMRKFNPVRDYLNGLEWDGCPRLAGGAWEGDTVEPLSVEYLGAPSDQIYATMVRKWHIAAVARILRPGCKVDTMVVFESSQGKMKSSYLRLMATIGGHEYFADSVGDIANSGSIMLLQGTWLVEISELAAFDRKEIGHIKAWLSRTTDRFVPKYESEPREVPRHYAVAGTHNPSGHGYLKDPTGARRFWPVPTGAIDIKRVRLDQDQIWAEAVCLFKAGQKWWLTPDEQAQCDALTSDRRAEEAWSSRIDEITRSSVVVRLQEVMTGLSIPAAQQNELTVKRISEHLRYRGWHREARGEGERVWVRASEPQEEMRV